MPEEPAENRTQNKGGINENELNCGKWHFKSPKLKWYQEKQRNQKRIRLTVKWATKTSLNSKLGPQK